MTTKIRWNITQLECKPIENGNEKVVSTVHWRIDATDGTEDDKGNLITGMANYFSIIPFNESGKFTAFEDLDEATVIGWAKAALGIAMSAAYENTAVKNLDEKLNPPIISPTMPWATLNA